VGSEFDPEYLGGRIGAIVRNTFGMASAKKAKPVVKRLGRPRDTSSVDTKQRILVVAREMFSVHGYEITTNRDIATAVGITPGALYHYFGSKLALYLAVHEDTQTQVYEQFTKAIIGHESFIGQFEAVLDIAHEMNIEDASVARFIGAVRVDSGRHPDMAAALSTHVRQREGFFAIMIDLGVERGEIARENRLVVQAYLLTVLMGLTDAVSEDHELQKRAIQGIKLAMRGQLVKTS
jgi:AcrR family transcriptional regulator